MKPNCEYFKPDPNVPWRCAWWEAGETTTIGIEYFCSRPDWEERICETQGWRLTPEARLVQNVKAQDTQTED